MTDEPQGYWYGAEDPAAGILRALRRFRRSDEEMRRRMSADMGMNVSDVQGLQLVIAAEKRGEPATPRQVATHLGISTASTTKLIDRLTASGHLRREPHPKDRRSVVLVATDHAHREVRERMARMHRRMGEIARDVRPEARDDVIAFLLAMAEELDRAGTPEPLSPRPVAGA